MKASTATAVQPHARATAHVCAGRKGTLDSSTGKTLASTAAAATPAVGRSRFRSDEGRLARAVVAGAVAMAAPAAGAGRGGRRARRRNWERVDMSAKC